ncbi:zf-TFIIB domain-containing protein [Jeongeupia naejangsanensis]|uniref:Zf-TFIIB domain-containing protein n=1 Tax=Jeongeupia naejangsanensis TaxID=613195 RepID=A0ABS2BLW9_9NEIS|nr:zf-TFIIB domain-containing protein [Jeongeupia naejangsanensis]MBM3116604.1 zf-TFIIB domain-containing protein [Jeongeupia naejangsanensis]
MQCPTCVDERLVMSERQGVEIDYCPRCRGVWLDRGELDKIIERARIQDAQPAREAPRSEPQPQEVRYDNRPQHYDQKPHYDHKPYKKRKSIWEELFD